MIAVTEDGKSYMNIKSPKDGTLLRSLDTNGMLRLFKLSASPPLWHNVVSDTHRFSCGIHLTDLGAYLILRKCGKLDDRMSFQDFLLLYCG